MHVNAFFERNEWKAQPGQSSAGVYSGNDVAVFADNKDFWLRITGGLGRHVLQDHTDLHVLATGSHGSLLVPGLMWLECDSSSWMMKTLIPLPAPSTSGTSSPDVVGTCTKTHGGLAHS